MSVHDDAVEVVLRGQLGSGRRQSAVHRFGCFGAPAGEPAVDGRPRILCVGARTGLDTAAAAALVELLQRRGFAAALTDAAALLHGAAASGPWDLVCLSYLGLGAGPALIRYVVRRLRRILPEGTLILVCYWNEEGNKAATKAMLETAEADAYAITLPEAVELCVKAAKGELKADKADEAAPAPESPSGDKPKPRAPRRKPQSAAA